MSFDPLPFRIRVGVVMLDNAELDPAVDQATVGGRLIASLHQEARRLLDDESVRRLNEAATTRLAYKLLYARGDEPVDRILGSVELTPDVTRGGVSARRERVRTARERLVDDCDVLLVLTPDETTEKSFAGEGLTDLALLRARSSRRPIIAVPVTKGASWTVEGSKVDARSISGIELYNGWVVPPAKSAEHAANYEADVFDRWHEGGDASKTATPPAMPSESRETVRESIIPHYVRASQISGHFQKTYLTTARWVYSLAVAAVAFVAVGALIHSIAALAYALELAVLITILALIRRAHFTGAHEKWLAARFLTERLRHATYLVACGVRPAYHRIPPHVGGRKPPDLWMALAFEEICEGLPALPDGGPENSPMFSDFVRGSWVRGQLGYHEGTARKYERRSAFLERAGLAMFSLAIVVAVAHLVTLGAHALHFEWPEPPWLEAGLTWLALVLPAAGASIGGFRAHREFDRLANRSAAMVAALEDVDARLERVSDPQDLEEMLGEIEAVMVDEAQGWLMLLEPLKLEAV